MQLDPQTEFLVKVTTAGGGQLAYCPTLPPVLAFIRPNILRIQQPLRACSMHSPVGFQCKAHIRKSSPQPGGSQQQCAVGRGGKKKAVPVFLGNPTAMPGHHWGAMNCLVPLYCKVPRAKHQHASEQERSPHVLPACSSCLLSPLKALSLSVCKKWDGMVWSCS